MFMALKIGHSAFPYSKYFRFYEPQRKQARTYLIDNTMDAQPQTVSIAELEQQTGISVFPSVSDDVKSRGMELPEPKTYKDRKRSGTLIMAKE